MRQPILAENIHLRAEPGLRDAIHAAARKERTNAAEFLRRELRAIVERRGINLPPLESIGGAR